RARCVGEGLRRPRGSGADRVGWLPARRGAVERLGSRARARQAAARLAPLPATPSPRPSPRERVTHRGSLGSGNHFLEVQTVEIVYDPRAAETLGLHEGAVTVMIHTGSRGLGH